MPLDHVPTIGERISVRCTTGAEYHPVEVISMAECKRLRPDLFGGCPAPEAYNDPDDAIRAYRYLDGDPHVAGFMIMRFHKRNEPGAYEYNTNVEPLT
jgi:hypothetical protein